MKAIFAHSLFVIAALLALAAGLSGCSQTAAPTAVPLAAIETPTATEPPTATATNEPTATPNPTDTPSPKPTPTETPVPTPEIAVIDNLALAQEANPTTVTLDNGIGLDEKGHIVSRFNENGEWEAVAPKNYQETLMDMTHPINVRDTEGNPVALPSNLQLLQTNNVDPSFMLLASPNSFHSDAPPLTHENGELLSPQEVLEKALLGQLMEFLRWGREVNYPEGNENQGVFYAYDINTGEPILNADGTIQRQIVDLSQVTFKVILDRGQSTQLNLPTTQVEGQTNQNNQAYLPFPIEAGSTGRSNKYGVFINPENPNEIIVIGKHHPDEDGNGNMILSCIGDGFFYFSVLPESGSGTFNIQNLLVEQTGINTSGYNMGADDLERKIDLSLNVMGYLDVGTD